jgi:ribonucleoside-diphosphate reductase beta chain
MSEKSIINVKQVDFTKEPIFFGEKLNLQRYDRFKYENIFGFFKKQLGFFWRPEEIDLSGREVSDYNSLTDHQKFIFTKNLGYQILLDSIQSRGISNLLEDCSNPEFEAFAKIWEFMETLHSYSYTYIIKNVYSNPSEIFDEILKDDEILKRASSVTKYYDLLINSLSDDNEYEKKKKLYLTLMSINILEGIRFYVSFACSFSFAENKKMEGNAKILSLILRDEQLHVGACQFILKQLRTREEEGFVEVAKDCESIVVKMFEDAANEEMEWANYLFKDGSMLGLNAEILNRYMKWLTNQRMKAIGIKPIFEQISNPINWMKNWTESKSVQNAPQEVLLDSYVVGSLKNDLDKADLSSFKL